jgi:glycosyltransferase involved in cell wall biosynthesis
MFPEAEAACEVADVLNLPLAAIAIGSDVRVMASQSAASSARLARLLRRVDLPIAVSEDLCCRLARAAPDAAEPLLVYLGRDTAAFSPAPDRARVRREIGWPPEGIVVAYVGALRRSKGIEELAQVIPELLMRHPRLRFVCIGAGESRSALIEAAQRAGREDAVLLPGPVPPAEVPRYLQAADLFVFPSHSEGMPQAVLEAMNCGLPVVATRVGGMPEAILDEETGLLLEPGNTLQLARALERVISDDDFRERAGTAGLVRAREKFDPEAHALRFAQALHQLARQGRRSNAACG